MLSSKSLIISSPLLTVLAMLVVVYLVSGNSKKMLHRAKKLIKEILPLALGYLILGFVWRNFFPKLSLGLGMTTWLSLISLGLVIYVIYKVYQFLKRSNKSIQILWALIPFGLTLLPYLSKLI